MSDRGEQWARAERIAAVLTGGRATRGIVRAMYELVVADERTDLPSPKEQRPKPPVDARAVLKTKPKPARRARVRQPEQEGLW